MYLATKPSKRPIVLATQSWYAPKTSRKSSGSSRDDSGVEPTTSQNITDSCRRSASVRVAAETEMGVAGPPCAMGLPQPPQNLAAGSFSKPQAEHCEGNGDPHSAQKRRVPAFSAMQRRQRIYSLRPRDTECNGGTPNQATIQMANAAIASMPTVSCLMSPLHLRGEKAQKGDFDRMSTEFYILWHFVTNRADKTGGSNCIETPPSDQSRLWEAHPGLAGCGKNHGAEAICQVAMRNSL